MSHTWLKARFFGLHFSCRQFGSTFNQFNVIGLQAAEFGRISTNNGYYAVQGHSRSPTVVTTENPYATSY